MKNRLYKEYIYDMDDELHNADSRVDDGHVHNIKQMICKIYADDLVEIAENILKTQFGNKIEEKNKRILFKLYSDKQKKQNIKAKKFDQVGSQQDLSATLLAQLNIPHQDFLWSRNLLNPYTKNFAFFTWDNGLGFINNNHYVTFDTIGNNILYNSNPSDQKQTNLNLNQGKSYLQSVYQQFIKL